MADIVGFLGYHGQTLEYLDDEHFSLVQGNSLCLVDVEKGPREMILRTETGISCFASNAKCGYVAIASDFGGGGVDVVRHSNQQSVVSLANPTCAKIKSLAFSRAGDRLFALTDASQSSDSSIMCWELASGTLIFVSPTGGSYNKVLPNPGNEIQFALYGNEGIIICIISEVMGSHTVRYEGVSIEPDASLRDQSSLANNISCALWTPFDHLLVGNLQGNILEVSTSGTTIGRVLNKTNLKNVGNYIEATTDGKAGVPTCITLGLRSLVVCTSTGLVVWFKSHDFRSNPDSKIVGSDIPLQIAFVKSHISTLSVDPLFNTFVIGTLQGEIVRLNMEIRARTAYERTDEDAYQAEYSAKVDDSPLVFDAPILNRYQSGSILCSASMSIPNNSNKKRMSVYVVGAQSGSVSFWLQPFIESDKISENIGVRRAVPRIMTHLSTIQIQSHAATPPVICSLTAVQFRTKRSGQLLMVGLDNGWVETWEVICQVSEDEDEEEGVGSLNTKLVGMRRFFTTPVTSVTGSSFSFGANNQMRYCFAVSSNSDSLVYITEVFNTMDGFAFDVQTVIKLEDSANATSCLLVNDVVWICAGNGRLFKHKIETLQSSSFTADLLYPSPEVVVDSCYPCVLPPLLSPTGALVSCGVGSNHLFALSLADGIISAKSSSHSDVIVCCSNSFHYIASGCIDGSVYIWDVSGNAPILVNRMQIHSGPVITLCFSVDGSLLLSTSADGSYFISTVSKARQVEETIMKLNEIGNTDSKFVSKTIVSTTTWMEQKKIELLEHLKQLNENNMLSVSSAVSEIKGRLEKLLNENAERTELEVMDRLEFVVDIMGQENINLESQRRADAVRMSCFKLNSYHELIAARVRQTCWDSMLVQSRCLLPLLEVEIENITAIFSSLPIRKCSDDEALNLERIKRLRAIEMRSQQKDNQGVLDKLASGKSRCSWSTSIKGCPETVSWLAFDGTRWPCADVIEMLAEKEKSEAAAGKSNKDDSPSEEAEVSIVEEEDSQVMDADREVDDNDVFNLLYPPQCVRTQTQKRIQIHLLKEVGRVVRTKFNAHFDKLVREKEEVMSSVESRNTRIRAILEELNEQDELFQPVWKDSEIVGGAITVRDEEVVNRPYESEAQRAIRLREEEEKRRREAEKDAEDVKGRALDEMMHGTLEVKRDVFAEASSLHRPAWMDEIPVGDMTESQLKEVEAFEIKLKAIQEEQAKYRKALEIEMKKLKIESIEVCKGFDEKLKGMVKVRVIVQKEILSQELYIARLAQSMAQHDQAWQLLKKNEVLINSTGAQRSQLQSKIDLFSSEVEKVRSQLSASQEEERNMEKGFKRDIQTLCNVSFDQEQLKIFTQLYRTRMYPEGEEDEEEEEEVEGSELLAGGSGLGISKGDSKSSKGKSSSKKGSSMAASGAKKAKAKASRGGVSGTDALGPMQEAAKALGGEVQDQLVYDKDPFFSVLLQQEKLKKNAVAAIPLLVPLNMESDCPEGFDIDQFQWSKLQELRNARIEKEIESIILSREHGELKQKLDQLCSEEALVMSCMKDLLSLKESTLAKLQTLENDLVVIIGIKQGQDEVDREEVVTDYSNASLVPVEVVKKFNDRIKEHGKEKIGVLNRIKHFRRKINILDWEAQHLQLESHHYDEYYTDLQLLRVTRDLQHVIREGSNAEQAKARLDRVGMRKDFLQKDAEEKIRKLRKANEALRRLVKCRSDESASLNDKILKLGGEVDARENVLKSREDARGTTGNSVASAQLKMKKVIAKRQLVDTARAQAEEIDFLRQELDRMRQRTFPSFVRAAKKRSGL